jgi:hypothetical protein
MADLVLGVAKSLVEGTLTKAQSAIDEESKLRQSTQRDLVFIAGEFQMMQSFLRITTKEQVRNSVVSTWVTQVRDLAYDVEDCIEFVIHMDTKSDWWHRLMPPFLRWPLPLDVAVGIIEQLKARVHDVSQRNERYKLISDPGAKPVMETRQLSVAGASGVLDAARSTAWRQQELETFIKLVTKEDSKLQVISVCVSASDLGNASIIKKAYSHPEICRNFKYRAWVKLLHEQPGAILSNVQQFMEQVNNQRYLIVLEDMPTKEEWDTIKKYLPDSNMGSRIIVSTQYFAVARFCTGIPCFQWFSADQSFWVFFQEVCGNIITSDFCKNFPLSMSCQQAIMHLLSKHMSANLM